MKERLEKNITIRKPDKERIIPETECSFTKQPLNDDSIVVAVRKRKEYPDSDRVHERDAVFALKNLRCLIEYVENELCIENMPEILNDYRLDRIACFMHAKEDIDMLKEVRGLRKSTVDRGEKCPVCECDLEGEFCVKIGSLILHSTCKDNLIDGFKEIIETRCKEDMHLFL